MGLLDVLADAPTEPLRAQAAAALQSGLPTKKTEAWRFTSVRHLVDAARVEVAPNIEVTLRDGVTAEWVASHELVGTMAESLHFAALNTVRHEKVLVVRATGADRSTVTLRIGAAGEGQITHPRILVIAEKHSELTLVERYEPGAGLVNVVTEMVLEDGAAVDHTRLHLGLDQHVGTLAVHQKRDTCYGSRVFSFGGALVRLALRVALHGPGASASTEGAYHVTDGEHVDHHLFVDHIGPKNTSTQVYRGVLDGKGSAVFDGQSIVGKDAPGSECHQSNGNLLLSDRATLHTKPHLEINNDDVVASHGATAGALDSDALFYLQSRGIPHDTARAMLTDAFLRAVLDDVQVPEVLTELRRALVDRGLSMSGASELEDSVSEAEA